jgi:aspartate aminotransferase
VVALAQAAPFGGLRFPPMSRLAQWFLELDRAAPQIRLDRGQLDLRPPAALLRAGIEEIESGSLAYSREAAGLVEAATEDFWRRRRLRRDLGAVIVTHGIISGLSCVFQRMLRPGDEVLVPLPCWPAIPSLVSAAKGVPRPYAFASQADARTLPDRLDALATGRTRMIVLNVPANPTGVTIEPAGVSELLAAAERRSLTVVWDDAYESFAPAGPDTRLLDASRPGAERSLLLTSFSKRFAAPGLRVGLLRTPTSLAPELWDECLLQTGGVSRIAQACAAQILREGRAFERQVAAVVSERRGILAARIGAERLVDGGSGAGMYVMTRVPPASDGIAFAHALLARGIATVPGELLGLPNSVRMTLAVDAGRLADVAERFDAAWRRA